MSAPWIMNVRIATVNDDFTDRKTNIPLVTRFADIILTQENKHDNVHTLVPAGWSVHQVRRNASTRGSAVAWRTNKPFRKASVDQKLAVRGRGILPRYMTIAHGRIGLAPVTFIATHRPPRRHKRLWRNYDLALSAYCRFLRFRGRFVIVGLDANDRTRWGQRRLAAMSGMRPVFPSRSLDGFLVSYGMGVHPPELLPKWHSDHHPVLISINIPNRRKA